MTVGSSLGSQVLGTPSVDQILREVALIAQSKLSSPQAQAVLRVRLPSRTVHLP